MNRIAIIAILVAVSLACCVWAGGPETQLAFQDIQGTVGIANGGTGQTASSAALAALGGVPTNGSGVASSAFATAIGCMQTKLISVSTATATPSVSSGQSIYLDYSSTISVTDFPGGISGQVITVLVFARGAGTTITIARSATIRLAGGTNFVISPNTYGSMVLMYDGGAWNEISRASNIL